MALRCVDKACRTLEHLPMMPEEMLGRRSGYCVFGQCRGLALQPAELGKALAGKLVGQADAAISVERQRALVEQAMV